MEERYIKVTLSHKDKLNLLLFDLLPERLLYQNNSKPCKNVTPVTIKEIDIKNDSSQDHINTKEDTLMFFDFVDTDVKSNL